MKRAYRRALLFISVAFFLGAAPLLVFRAMGYRLSIPGDELAGVGVILIDSNPSRAQILVGESPIGKTPRAIPNLIPGDVRVTVEKEGYHTWEKHLSVEPTTVTELRSIRLFPKAPVHEPIANNVTQFSLSPNRGLIAYINEKNTLFIIDEEGTQVALPVVLKQPITSLLWSPDNSRLLLNQNGKYSLVDATQRRLFSKPLSSLNGVTEVAWDQRVPGRLLAINKSNQLIAFHVATNTTEIIASKVNTFATSGRHIFVSASNNQLTTYNLQGQELNSSTLASTKTPASLHVTPGEQIAITFTDNSISIMNEERKLVSIADHSLRAGWSPDEQLLYVQTDETSLQVYNAQDERLYHIPLEEFQLVVRLSRPIHDPQWFAGGRHLIYQVDDQIFITEIDTRDHPISHTVNATNLGDSKATVGGGGQSVFYLKKEHDITSLIRTPLTLESENFFDFIN